MRVIDGDKLSMYLADYAFAIAPDERDDDTKKEYTEHDMKKMQYETIYECIRAVDQAPQVLDQALNKTMLLVGSNRGNVIKRNQGAWIVIDERHGKCPFCGFIETTGGKDKTGRGHILRAVYSICRSCGADLSGKAERRNNDKGRGIS